jgi:hypothetical protein
MTPMRVRPFLGVFAGVAIFLAMLLVSSPAFAQGEKVQRGPIVIKEIKHVVSTVPLRDLKNVFPLIREEHEIDNFPLHPLRPITNPPDAGLQTSTLPLVSTTDGLTFNGLGANSPGWCQCAPPDTNGAVGGNLPNGSPGQYVQWVNSEFDVYSKADGHSIMGPTQGNVLWTALGGPCFANNSGDPVAQYDKLNNRWVLVQPVFSGPPFYLCVAVSKTSDATGLYNEYAFNVSNDFDDYPKLGIWSDAYYATYNLFNGGFVGPLVCAMDGAKMRAGLAATEQCFMPAAIGDGLLPADVDGTTPPPAGQPEFILGFNTGTNNSLDLYKFHIDFAIPGNSTFTGPTSLSVNAFGEACGGFGACIPNPGGTVIDSLGDRMMYRLAYRNLGDHEALVTNHSVTAGNSTGVRWYEIRSPANNPVVFQQGTFAPDSSFRWMGSIAMDKSGDIAVGYSVSSSTLFPSIAYTGRVPGDTMGMMETEKVAFAGLGSQTDTSSRWGDYSAMQVDPVDDCTFWYTQEYYPAGVTSFNWRTYINTFKFNSCGSTLPDFTISAAPPSQTVVAGNPTSYTVTVAPLNGFNGTVTLSNGSLPTGVGLSFTPPSITGGSGSSTVNVTTSNTTPAGTYTLTLTGTSGALMHSTTVQLIVTNGGKADFTISASPASQSVGRPGTATYTVTVTGQNGFNGVVTLKVTGLPTKVSQSFSPPTITGSGTSTLTLTTQSGTGTGMFKLTISGKSGTLHHNTTVKLTIM